MTKRSWTEVEGAETQPGRRMSAKVASKTHRNRHVKTDSPQAGIGETNFFVNGSYPDTHPPTPILTDAASEPRSAKAQSFRQREPSSAQSDNEPAAWPSITRKVKACAACRKQKVGQAQHWSPWAAADECRSNVTWMTRVRPVNDAGSGICHAS
jgi:hypothetical protein